MENPNIDFIETPEAAPAVEEQPAAAPLEEGALSNWFDGIVAAAKELNHTVWVSITPGKPKTGDPLTFAPLGGSPDDGLQPRLTLLDAYLKSDEAKVRGELYAKREEALKAVEAAQVALADARIDLALADLRITDDTNNWLAKAEARTPDLPDAEDVEWMNAPMGPKTNDHDDDGA